MLVNYAIAQKWPHRVSGGAKERDCRPEPARRAASPYRPTVGNLVILFVGGGNDVCDGGGLSTPPVLTGARWVDVIDFNNRLTVFVRAVQSGDGSSWSCAANTDIIFAVELSGAGDGSHYKIGLSSATLVDRQLYSKQDWPRAP